MITRAEILFIRSLADRKVRHNEQLFVAQGEKLVKELIDSGLTVKRLLYCGKDEKTIPLAEHITPSEMQRISTLKTHSEYLAVVQMPRYVLQMEEIRESLSLALDDIQDPGNMGTIIRIADWFGIKNIVCSYDTVDCFNHKVIQATMGSITRVKVHYVNDLSLFLASVKIPVYGTSLQGESIYDCRLDKKAVIVMGNEGKGLSAKVEAHLSQRLYIPSFPGEKTTAESLNVATATAIVCSEFRRQM